MKTVTVKAKQGTSINVQGYTITDKHACTIPQSIHVLRLLRDGSLEAAGDKQQAKKAKGDDNA